MQVPGLEGVPSYVSKQTRVEITLGPRVFYVMNLLVANIGQGVEVFLGLNCMRLTIGLAVLESVRLKLISFVAMASQPPTFQELLQGGIATATHVIKKETRDANYYSSLERRDAAGPDKWMVLTDENGIKYGLGKPARYVSTKSADR
ncbi:unnamed protein product [Phytophthora fragariaefolia]|uniref:Unnamed protein product n=1 Tax=Phytophthora fragariaefolia TaxID=1490495 RepID=A0A9W6XVM7_9STRA|nr:unnamed protein product [Phytophthora fragariaefolia]